MRIAVVHTTLYRYSSPVFLEPHTIRLRPREDASQRLGSWTLGITPAPVGRTECLDQDGNTVVRAWFHGLTPELGLHTEFTLENVRGNPFDYLLTALDVKLPMEYAAPLRAALAPYLRQSSSAEVREFARSLAEECGWQTMAFLGTLNQRLFDRTRQIVSAKWALRSLRRPLCAKTGKAPAATSRCCSATPAARWDWRPVS